MRRNSYTSASDRRWQRRYERIQQRREEELERRDRQGRYEGYETISVHDLGIDSLMASSPTFTVEIQRPDEPNLNGTVISEEAWGAAWTRYLQRAANESRRSLSEQPMRIMLKSEADYGGESEMRSVQKSKKHTRLIGLVKKSTSIPPRDVEQGRGYRAQTMVIDDYSGLNIRFKNGEYIIIDDIAPAFEPEPELKAGDSAELDSFLGNFVAPGA